MVRPDEVRRAVVLPAVMLVSATAVTVTGLSVPQSEVVNVSDAGDTVAIPVLSDATLTVVLPCGWYARWTLNVTPTGELPSGSITSTVAGASSRIAWTFGS